MGGLLLATALLFERSDAMFGAVALLGAVLSSWAVARLAPAPSFFQRTMPSAPATRGRPVAIGLVPPPGGEARAWPALAVWDWTPWGRAPANPNRAGTALGYSFTPPERGVFQLGPAQVGYRGPLGLVAVAQPASRRAPLVVGPPLVELEVPWPEADSDRHQVRSSLVAERVTDPSAVRDYQPGDPRRLVHWKATARRDRLMVRQTVRRALPDAWILVDDAAPPGEAAEQALSIAASVAVKLLRARHTVRLAPLRAPGPPARFTPGGGADPVLEAFARVELGQAASGNWVARLAGDFGSRGATGPIYGALAQLDSDLLAELRSAGGLAHPGVLWLVGEAARQRVEVARAGWVVAEVGA
ncbi:MAG: DUF58 domain-containing protein [Bifidobacteriaceae bacterium]|jgi:uncharacterized protein (DUF58 family)|nr:DUF58 domain-containing protein [Bifidobacteriaceae bacterium]